MVKFRIIKKETTNGAGDVNVRFEIQKKFLFWWRDAPFLTHYHTYTDYNASHRNEPTHMAMLTNRYYFFDSEERAKNNLAKLENPFVEDYKGDKIIRVFNDHDLKDVYINKSYAGVWHGGIGYEFAWSLESLKEMIDRRKLSTKVSVL